MSLLPRWSPLDKAALGLSALSAGLIVLAFPDWGYSPLVFCFAVPWLWALESVGPKMAYGTGVVFGTLALWGGFYWIGNWAALVLEWPWPLNHLVGFGYALVCAQAFGLIGWLVVKLRRPLGPLEPFGFAFVWLLVFSLFPWLFPFTLADSLGFTPLLLQPLEWTGPWALDFLILVSNGAIYLALRRPPSRPNGVPMLLATIFALTWVGLSHWRLLDLESQMAGVSQRRLGLVQTNRPASLKRQPPEPGFSPVYPLEMKLSQSLAEQGAELIFWPEGHFYGYAYWVDVEASFHQLTAEMAVPLFFLDSGWDEGPEGRRHYNTTFFLTAQGELGGTYQKRHLVPFGETTPLVSDWPWLKSLLGAFLSNLSAGTSDAAFEAAGIRVVPKICYEILFPVEVAEAIGTDGSGKLILVQSQDGWYGQSSQPRQHLASSILRAVENRVPLVHVINNGPSAVVLPTGKLSFLAPAFERGAWIAPLPFEASQGGSFYSRHPGWTLGSLRWLGALLLLWGWWSLRKSK
ncbi:MAG: apolipoprotein N-acyltransferase [bacterium]|nr:apolipoprotein N-acyltransferase [bacterium]